MNWYLNVWQRLMWGSFVFWMAVWMAAHRLDRQHAVRHFSAAARAHTCRKLTQYPTPSLGFITYIVRWLYCNASVADHCHPLPNGFSMCLAAHWLQRSPILESWNEAGHCCAAAGGGHALLWKENLTGRKLRNKVLRKADKGHKGRNCVCWYVGERVCYGAVSPLPAIMKTNGTAQKFVECSVALNFR